MIYLLLGLLAIVVMAVITIWVSMSIQIHRQWGNPETFRELFSKWIAVILWPFIWLFSMGEKD